MLIKDINEIIRYFPNNTFKDFNKFDSYMQNAELTYIVKVLGVPLHQKLESLYIEQGLNIENDDYRRLLEKVQRPLVQFGIYQALPMLNVTINENGGMTVQSNTNSAPISKDRFNALAEATLRQAWDSIDNLLEYLERNSKHFTDESKNELWKQSEWYWQQTGLLIFTANEFEESGVYIGKNRRKFIQLLPSMRLMERSYIRPAIGNKQADEIIRRKMNGKLSEADKEVLPLLQSALALYTKAYDLELNKPEDTHGYNSLSASKMAAENLSRAMRKMKGNVTDYPDFPENEPCKKKQEYVQTDSNDPFFLLSGYSTKDKKTP